MKEQDGQILLMVGVVWLLMAIFPPWMVVDLGQFGGIESCQFFTYAPIFLPPDPALKGYYAVHIDLFRLAIQWLVSGVVIFALVRFITARPKSFDESDVPVSTERGKYMTVPAACFVAAVLLPTHDAWELIARANHKPVPAIMGDVVYAIKEIPAGVTLTADMMEAKRIEQFKIPMDAVVTTSSVLGHKTKEKIEYGTVLGKHSILF